MTTLLSYIQRIPSWHISAALLLHFPLSPHSFPFSLISPNLTSFVVIPLSARAHPVVVALER